MGGLLEFLLGLIPAPWLAVLRDLPWKWIGAVLAAVLFACLVLMVNGWRVDSNRMADAQDALRAERACEKGTDCARRALVAAVDGQAAVEKARQAAQEAASKEQARVAAEGQAAVKRAQAAASVATVRLREAEARLRNSIARDASCAAQAQEVIACEY